MLPVLYRKSGSELNELKNEISKAAARPKKVGSGFFCGCLFDIHERYVRFKERRFYDETGIAKRQTPSRGAFSGPKRGRRGFAEFA
jgi:hypothetical protein